MALIGDLGCADAVERVNIVAIAVEEVVNAIVVTALVFFDRGR
jgi:hypothetical protein